ncbi:MAG: hypothetical protein ACOYOS_00030 [Syntrophales bacterium]
MSERNDCYRLIQMIAIRQDPFCIVCGAPSEVGHHLWRRNNLSTAFHPEAVRGLCNPHHGFAHAKPTAFKAHMQRLMGPRYHELQKLSKTVVKGMDYVAKRSELRGILEDFEQKAVNF